MIGKAASFIKSIFNKSDSQQETIANFQTTIIRVDNNYVSSSAIVVDEVLVGNIYSLKEVQVSSVAEISGNIMSKAVFVGGRVDGDIIAVDFAEIKSTAIVNGNIRAKAISIAAGALINGSIRVEGNIDERDLILKVENKVPGNNLPEPFAKTRALPEAAAASVSKDLVNKDAQVPRTPRVERSSQEPVVSDSWY